MIAARNDAVSTEGHSMNFCTKAQEVIAIETRALQELSKLVDDQFNEACKLLMTCKGRIIVLGMGKSGIIASKIAATLSSTGSPAFYLHPAEASHGDLGMITENDTLIMISYSGRTAEIITLIPMLKKLKLPMIAITGFPDSIIAKAAQIHLNVHVAHEACPLGLAPTASTTATLVMGDALAIALLEAKGFTREQFALAHPGGNLGKRLLSKVKDFMHSKTEIPRVSKDTLLLHALVEMSSKRLGMTTILDAHDRLLGIFTDGDLRRTLQQQQEISTIKIHEVMSLHPKTINENELASNALTLMETHKITALVVLDDQQKVSGILHLHDLLEEGL
jgi:arabinose-5-phosphate isomerase